MSDKLLIGKPNNPQNPILFLISYLIIKKLIKAADIQPKIIINTNAI